MTPLTSSSRDTARDGSAAAPMLGLLDLELRRRLDQALPQRVVQLEQVFTGIARGRMAGLPMLHPRLRVQAVGFAADEVDPFIAWGVLVTPWFMNLVRLPLCPSHVRWPDAQGAAVPASAWPAWPTAPGGKTTRRLASQTLEVIGAHEDTLGPYEMASLYSPMHLFADQTAAVATAREVVRQLRTPS